MKPRANRLCLELALLLATISTTWSFIVLAPSLFLAGNEETILVINPKSRTLKGEIGLANNPQLGTDPTYTPQVLTLQPGEFRVVKFNIHQNFTPFIDLKATFDGVSQIRTFSVSQRGLHIMVQTDKPIYSPKEKGVHVRVITVDQQIRPADRIYRVQIKNPENRLMMSKDLHNATLSMFHLNYQFPEDPDLGEWKVVVLYGNDLRQKLEQKFELQEYVLPTFRVDIDITDTLVPSMNSTSAKITATHVYGKPVQGQVFVKEFIETVIGNPTHYGSLNWTKLNEDGEAVFNIDLTKYKSKNVWRAVINEKRLLLQADVYELTSGKTVTVKSDRAVFERSFYKVSMAEMQKSIRPGYPALITIRVRYPNGGFAKDVPVRIRAYNDDERPIAGAPRRPEHTDAYGRASFIVPTEPSYTQIRVDFEIGQHKRSMPAHYTFRAHKERQYIALKKVPPEMQFEVGTSFPVEVHFKPENAFSGAIVAIIAAGRVLQVENMPKNGSRGVVNFLITPEMSPLARVVAVGYMERRNVSIDSYIMSIKPHCRHAEFELDCSFQPTPGGHGTVKVFDAELGTTVGLSIVDQAVYALKNRPPLTKKQIFDRFMEADRGCSDGGGADVEESAGSAGLVLITDRVMTKSCQDSKEKRRSRRSALLKERSNDEFALKCCELAYSKYHSSRSCEERSESLIHEFDGQRLREVCQQHFLQCCHKPLVGSHTGHIRPFSIFTRQKLDGRQRIGGVLPDPQDFIEEEEEPVPEQHIRKDFRESLLFQNIEITENHSISKVDLTLPHSITTWSLETISVNPRGGVCAKDPIEITALKEFFIQLDLPYKVIRNEHVQIKVTLYNYRDVPVSGNLYIYGVEGVCTEAAPGQRSEKKSFRIQPYSSYKIAYPVFPTHNGTHEIRVEALTLYDSDAIVKKLYVVPEGREVRKSYSVALDPMNSQRRKARSITCGPSCESKIDASQRNQTIVIDTSLPDDVVDGTDYATLRVIGEKMGPAIVTALDDIESMLTLPKGCGEQNMMRLAPLVFVTEFRKAIQQLDVPTEKRAKDHIMMAYNRQLGFRKPNGSFSAFRNRGSSVWLTAFVAKVFCRASPFFTDSETFREASADAVDWLLTKQGREGSFEETKPILHKSLLGGVKGRKALTAFVTLALDECRHNIRSENHQKWRSVLDQAKLYLMRTLDQTHEGYTAALMAYALSDTNVSSQAMTNLRNHLILNQEINTFSIATNDNAPSTIEGNGYALLAATKTQRNDMSLPLSNWLITQQGATGGFQSTQDTVVALQALSEYFSKNRESKIDLSVLISHGKHFKRDLRVAEDSAMTLQTMTTNDLGDKMYVHATGSGTGLLSVLIKYNTILPLAERCIFNVTINATIEEASDMDSDPYMESQIIDSARTQALQKVDELLERYKKTRRRRSIRPDQLVYRLDVCAYVLGDEPSGMSVIEVDMITGYAPIKGDLVLLQQRLKIDRFEILPDRVNLYITEFPVGKKLCYDFRVVQEFTVSNAQPATVSVYDYYTKGGNCPTFYELRSFKKVLVECASQNSGSRLDKMCTCIQNSCPSREPFRPKVKEQIQTIEPGREIVLGYICNHDLAFVGTVRSCSAFHRTIYCQVMVSNLMYSKSPEAGDIVTFAVHEYCKKVMIEGDQHLFLTNANLPHKEGGVLHRNHTLSSKSIIYRLNGAIDANIVASFDYVAKNMRCPD
ncbi:ovostatin-like [Varroa destructor]|uniref:Uncharacterized protein n=1 Tax=Varroa destructor TaxID=109461 RepID=A0A7M7MHK2_VARDE|nr:ovostatin-like [Varroa destructor]